jgi:hypothetical protein
MNDWVGNMLRSQGQRRLRRRRPVRKPECAAAYGGRISLTGLIPVSLDGLGLCEPQTTMALVASLARALRTERRRASAGTGSYDVERHLRLCAAYEAERRKLARLRPRPRP